MKALILAAGFGSRLKYKTENLPKSLIDVKGKPILNYQLTNLLEAGINEVGIVIGFNGKLIQEYVEKYFPQIIITFIENNEYATSNSSYSFWQAKEYIKGQSYLHFNCEILFTHKLLKCIIESSHPNIIGVREDMKLGKNMENVTLDEDRITNMSLTNTFRSSGKAFGIAKFSWESTKFIIEQLENYIQQGNKNQAYYGIIHHAVKVLDYRAMLTDKRNLHEINTLDDYLLVKKLIKDENPFDP